VHTKYSKQKEDPPKWLIRFFRWYCNDHLSDAALGDMVELYGRRKRKLGKRKADLLFAWNVMCFLQPFAIKRNSSAHLNPFDMFKNYFKIARRAMWQQKMFIFVNIFGMSIAIACCIIAYYTYDFNETFDQNNTQAAKIYRVNSVRQFQSQLTEYGYVPLPLSESIRQNVGDVEKVIRYSPEGADIRIGDDVFAMGISYVDVDFFNVFTFEFKEGNPTDFRDKSKIFLNEIQAKTFFGNEPALGKPITQILPNGKLWEFTVGGVFRLPPSNSSFNDNAFSLYDNLFDKSPEMENGTNWKYSVTLFVTIIDPSRLSSVGDHLKPFANANNKVREDFVIKEFRLDPFQGMALRDRKIDRQGNWTHPAISNASIVGCAAMAIFILLIACFNLTNTAVSVASGRLKEIGIRKVMGGVRAQLILQFLGETMGICFISLILGIVIAELFLIPAFNNLWPYLKLSTNYTGQPGFLIFLTVTLLFTGLLAGSYPALYVTKFQPIVILKGKLKFGGASFFSRTLLTLQFAISLIAIVCSLAFVGNARYQRDLDPGFDQKGVVYTYVNNGNEFETFRNAMAENNEVISIAGSKDHVSSHYYHDPIKYEAKEMEVDIMDGGDRYLKTTGFHLVEGRDFQKDSETDLKESVIITEKFAAKFGWEKPIGKEILWKDTVKLQVIGVVKDVYTRGLWREMEPMMMRYTPQKNYTHFIVSASPKNVVEVNRFMEKRWRELFPDRVYRSRYMDDVMAEAALTNNNIVTMFVFLGMVAMMLSATGLFTLVSLNIVKKMKEIGVRKVFGASAQNIARVINVEFVIALLIASLLGSYLGSSLSTSLMRSIWKYYQPVSAMALGLSVFVLFGISALTIGFKIYNAAKMNPMDTLRDE